MRTYLREINWQTNQPTDSHVVDFPKNAIFVSKNQATIQTCSLKISHRSDSNRPFEYLIAIYCKARISSLCTG